MNTFSGYPILLRLENRRCVVIGGGNVAARKVHALLEAGAAVTVISPMLSPALESLIETIDFRESEYVPGMLAELHPLLVFAATDSAEVNSAVADEARSLGVLVDVVSEGGDGDFSSMATVERGPVTIGIATGGASPALAARLREVIEAAVGDEYGTLAEWMAEFRPLVRERVKDARKRQRLWQAVIDSPILDDLKKGNTAYARQRIEDLVKAALEP